MDGSGSCYSQGDYHLEEKEPTSLCWLIIIFKEVLSLPPPLSLAQELDPIVDIIEEAWDHHSDARLTATCILERIKGFQQVAVLTKDSDSGFETVQHEESGDSHNHPTELHSTPLAAITNETNTSSPCLSHPFHSPFNIGGHSTETTV